MVVAELTDRFSQEANSSLPTSSEVGTAHVLDRLALLKFASRQWHHPSLETEHTHMSQHREHLLADPAFTEPESEIDGEGLSVFLGPGYGKSPEFYADIKDSCKGMDFNVESPEFTDEHPNNATAADFRKYERKLMSMPGKVFGLGHSNGGMTLRALALLHPEKFDSLFMITAPIFHPTDMPYSHVHPKLHSALNNQFMTQMNPFAHAWGMAFTPREAGALFSGYRSIDRSINVTLVAAIDDAIVNPAKCVDTVTPHAKNIVTSGGHFSAISHSATHKEMKTALQGFAQRQRQRLAA